MSETTTATTTTTTTTTASSIQNHIVYRTVASGDEGVGYVVNSILWDGASTFDPGSGLALALDADRAYPIGSTYTPSTEYALSGAATATAGTPLTLTLTPDNDGPGADTTVTLSDGNAGGTFSAETVTFNGCTNTAQTVTYTPKAAGTVTISATNNGSLTNPASLSVTVSAAAAAT
ncbi:hypothetical protein LDL36_14135 [Komagataeibacter sp. FNDCR1]|nr:hypothetical protein [Komagataeibacter sp. FNDCR1]